MNKTQQENNTKTNDKVVFFIATLRLRVLPAVANRFKFPGISVELKQTVVKDKWPERWDSNSTINVCELRHAHERRTKLLPATTVTSTTRGVKQQHTEREREKGHYERVWKCKLFQNCCCFWTVESQQTQAEKERGRESRKWISEELLLLLLSYVTTTCCCCC